MKSVFDKKKNWDENKFEYSRKIGHHCVML